MVAGAGSPDIHRIRLCKEQRDAEARLLLRRDGRHAASTKKKAPSARICQKPGDNPGLRPQEVFIDLAEVARENWSFGNGKAQYA